ncbi:MAG: polysaccharide deacetylase family protein [Fimbriimonas sp.]
MVRVLSERTVILTYHDMVRVRDKSALWFDCTPLELQNQLDWLSSQGAHFISMQQLYRHLTAGSKLPPKPVMITFADNYLGFYYLALPILRGRNVPATMFVHTDFVGAKVGRPKMSWKQLLELDREGLVTIASQTRSHPADLRRLSDRQLALEIAGSKEALEQRLGHPVPFIAYPNGKFDLRVAQFARRAGYLMAFTEEQTPAEVSPSIFEVARYVHTKYREAWKDAGN